MNPRALLGVVAGLAIAALGVREALILTGDEQPPQAGDVPLHPQKVVGLRDGGIGYAKEVRTADGGVATRVDSAPECVRRLADAGVGGCRRVLSDGGIVDPGTLNRFPADASVGTRCSPCACSVYLGESADDEESVLVERSRDGGGR